MFKSLIKYFSFNKPKEVFTTEYRKAYVKCWVNNIKDYNP